jgi:hypothetical protein
MKIVFYALFEVTANGLYVLLLETVIQRCYNRFVHDRTICLEFVIYSIGD